ncbi:MAG TPA: hypothetical protein VI299_11125, partial [Polyangiales bacterium]
MARFTASDFDAFVDGLLQGDVAPERWAACAQRLVGGLHGDVLDAVIAALAERFTDNLDEPDLLPRRLLVLDALASTLDSRPAASRISDEAIAQLGEALVERTLSPQVRARGERAHEGLEMSRARYRGTPVSEDVLATCSDVDLLWRFARLLPTPADRRLARTRYVELAIAASPSDYVRTHVEQTRARVLSTGRNALDLTTAVITGTSSTTTDSPDSVVAEQHLATQTARLLLHSQTGTALVPAIDLRKILRIEVKGVDSSVTLCGPANGFDVTPCIDSARVEVGGPVAVLDGEGGLHMRDDLTSSELADLLVQGSQLTVPVLLGVTQLAVFRWPMRVQPPDDVTFTNGEPLRATVERFGARIAVTFGVLGTESSSLAFVEASEV